MCVQVFTHCIHTSQRYYLVNGEMFTALRVLTSCMCCLHTAYTLLTHIAEIYHCDSVENIFTMMKWFLCFLKSQSKIISRLVMIWFHFDFLEKWKLKWPCKNISWCIYLAWTHCRDISLRWLYDHYFADVSSV